MIAHLLQLARFAAVGILATLVHAGVYAAAVHLAVPPQAANLLAFACAFPVSYVGMRRFVFRSPRPARLRFALLQGGGLALNAGWVWLAGRTGLPPVAAVAGMLCVTPAIAFLVARTWVFAPEPR